MCMGYIVASLSERYTFYPVCIEGLVGGTHVFKMVSIFRQRPHPMALGFKGVSLAIRVCGAARNWNMNQLTKLHLRNVPSSTTHSKSAMLPMWKAQLCPFNLKHIRKEFNHSNHKHVNGDLKLDTPGNQPNLTPWIRSDSMPALCWLCSQI